jgi:hypothetical protein
MKSHFTIKQLMALLMCLLVVRPSVLAGVGKSNVRYLGGSFVGVEEGKEGEVAFLENDIAFTWEKQRYSIRYDQITSLEYGQKVGRRVGATIALGVTTLGLFALPMLFSKKRKHFATVGFKDDQGRPQGLILEFGKNINRSALKTMSLRSGIKIEFESEQAEKEFRH